MSTVIIVVSVLIGLRLGATLVLGALNRAETRRHADAPPEAVAAIMDRPTYARAVGYTLARSSFGRLVDTFDAIVLAIVLFSGVLPPIHDWVLGWGKPGATWTGAAFILVVGLILGALSLPFEAWEQFRIEADFGFNKTSPGLWVADKAKALALTLGIGFPLLWALLSLIRVAGSAWWIWGCLIVVVFQLSMVVVYPKWILPLFNKLQPLADGELRTRLLALGERTHFRARAIFVMDGSRRSSHSNAFFAGFGPFRQIVLFDTLIAQLSTAQLEAVLAHEIGHYRKGHVPKRLILMVAMTIIGFAAIAWLSNAPWFNPAFGFAPGDLAGAFLLFGLLSGLISFWFSPLANALSRKHEYEADAFASKAVGGPDPMIGALRRLAEKNLTNLTPHPLFSAFYYSHPTMTERERALHQCA